MTVTVTGGITFSGGLTFAPSGAAANDPYFMYNSLLLPGNGTNTAQNNTFLDGSTNNFTITRNGNTTQGTFSPYGPNWSNYFDGSGDYLTTTMTGGLGSGDFTVELWVYATSVYNYITWLATTRDATGFSCGTDANGALVWVNGVGGVTRKWDGATTAGNIIRTNSWNHVAFVRSSGSMKVYLNGTATVTTTSASSVSDSANYTNTNLSIGQLVTGGENPTGYLSSIRVTNTAVYTSNFTPSTTPLTAISGTSLLTCQSNRFIDNSTNAFAITVNGNTNIQRFSPFSPAQAYDTSTIGGSGYFDGTGDYLTVPSNAGFGFGSSDFTIEFWIYYPPLSNTNGKMVIDSRPLGTNGNYWSFGVNQVGIMGFGIGTGGSRSDISDTVARTNQWVHYAVSRSGGSLKLFANGAQVASTTDSSTSVTSGLFIGTNAFHISASDTYWLGYISNIRIVKGTAVYTSAFTPPTAPLTAIANTQLLLNYTNAGIIDNAMMNNLETVGNAQISTTQSNFGGSSMAFDGTGDYLVAPQYQNFEFGTSDFTIEGWIYMNSLPVNDYKQIVSFGTGPSSQRWILFIDTRTSQGTPYLRFLSINSSGTVVIDVPGAGSSGWSANTWYYVAVTRSGNTFKLFRDGVQNGATVTNAGSCPATASTGALYVGAEVGGGFANWNGYIDDLRITKGYARYTSNFTPPTTAFPTY